MSIVWSFILLKQPERSTFATSALGRAAMPEGRSDFTILWLAEVRQFPNWAGDTQFRRKNQQQRRIQSPIAASRWKEQREDLDDVPASASAPARAATLRSCRDCQKSGFRVSGDLRTAVGGYSVDVQAGRSQS